MAPKSRAKQGLAPEAQKAVNRMMSAAIKAWDLDLIKLAAEAGAETQELLIRAIAKKSDPMVRLALFYGADVQAMVTVEERKFQPVLHYAHDNFSEDVFQTILSQGVSIDARNPQGETVAMRAVKSGDFERLKFYATRKADVSSLTQEIFFKAIERKDVIMLQWSLDNGADVEGRLRQADGGMASAMHIACHHFDENIVGMLLKAGVSINARNSAGETVLHGAARIPEPAKTAFILSKGGDPLLTSYAGLTPLDEAMKHLQEDLGNRWNSSSTATKDNAKAVLTLLLGRVKELHGADPYSTAVNRDIQPAKTITFQKKPDGPA